MVKGLQSSIRATVDLLDYLSIYHLSIYLSIIRHSAKHLPLLGILILSFPEAKFPTAG